MGERADTVVVGAGVMGLAVAQALARAGRKPLVLEQFRLGHAHGSSHGATRIFRLAYDEPDWVRLAQEALPLWRALEAESGDKLLDLTGLVDLPVDADRLAATLKETGTAFDVLTAEDVRRRFDLVTSCRMAVWQPDAGVVLADRALRAFRAGVEVRGETLVRSLVPGAQGVRIETDRGTIDARSVVVAAGAWARRLLSGAGIDLAVVATRETVAYFRLTEERAVPSVIDYRNRETYALTAGPGVLKVGVHRSGPPTEPDEPGGPDDDIVAFASDWAAHAFPLAAPEPVSVETCLYTNTPDASFVLERHGPIVVCSACSGHGFKFAPAVGERVAALVTMT